MSIRPLQSQATLPRSSWHWSGEVSNNLTMTAKPRTADFDAFFREHYWPIVRSLTAAYGDAEAASEAVQDAFTKAYVRWRRVRGLRHPAGWVRHVAINVLRDDHRRKQRRTRTETAATLTDSGATLPTEYDEIARLLSPLPERQRTATALFYVEDLSVAAIATSMGITQGAVKAHLSQARANIAASLTPEGAGRG